MTVKTRRKNDKPDVISLGNHTIRIQDKEFILEKARVNVSLCDYDPDNPRYRNTNGSKFEINELVKKLTKEADTVSLADSIMSVGMLEPPMVQVLNGRFKVLEGNRRLRAIKMAKEKTGKSDYNHMDVYIIPKGMPEKYVNAHIGTQHLLGKKTWGKYSRALFFAKLVAEWEGDLGTVAKIVGYTKQSIKAEVDTVKMIDKAVKNGNVIAPEKFWHFYEFARLNENLRNDPEVQKVIFAAIEDDKFGDSNKVRQFPQIWENKKARVVFVEGKGKNAFIDATTVLSREEPDKVKKGVFNQMRLLCKTMEDQWKTILSQLKDTDSEGSKILLSLVKTVGEAVSDVNNPSLNKQIATAIKTK